MANNDEAGGSGGKAFWELSQEMEEQPHLYEAAAFPTDPETTDGAAEDDHTDATTDGAAEDATTDGPPRMPPLMMAAHAQMAANRRGNGRTGARPCSAPSRRKLLKWTPMGIQRRPNE